MRENSIIQFPKNCSVGFERLTNLRVLDIAYNALVAVPRQIGFHTILTRLYGFDVGNILDTATEIMVK